MKLCKNCNHYQEHGDKCKHEPRIDLVDGTDIYKDCREERVIYGNCGLGGVYYEEL